MTLSLPKSLYEAMDLNETLEYALKDDTDGKMLQNARNRTYMMNAWLKPKKFSVSIKSNRGFVIIKRVM